MAGAAAFTKLDKDLHAGGVNMSCLQRQGFRDAKAAAVTERQNGAVLDGRDGLQEKKDLLRRRKRGLRPIDLSAGKEPGIHGIAQNSLLEKEEGAAGGIGGIRPEMQLTGHMKKILFALLQGKVFWVTGKELSHAAQMGAVILKSRVRVIVQSNGIKKLLVIKEWNGLKHGNIPAFRFSLSVKNREEHCQEIMRFQFIKLPGDTCHRASGFVQYNSFQTSEARKNRLKRIGGELV